MTDLNQNVNEAKDFLNSGDKDMKKLPQMLNVLTILTYIACGVGALFSILGADNPVPKKTYLLLIMRISSHKLALINEFSVSAPPSTKRL